MTNSDPIPGSANDVERAAFRNTDDDYAEAILDAWNAAGELSDYGFTESEYARLLALDNVVEIVEIMLDYETFDAADRWINGKEKP